MKPGDAVDEWFVVGQDGNFTKRASKGEACRTAERWGSDSQGTHARNAVPYYVVRLRGIVEEPSGELVTRAVECMGVRHTFTGVLLAPREGDRYVGVYRHRGSSEVFTAGRDHPRADGNYWRFRVDGFHHETEIIDEEAA